MNLLALLQYGLKHHVGPQSHFPEPPGSEHPSWTDGSFRSQRRIIRSGRVDPPVVDYPAVRTAQGFACPTCGALGVSGHPPSGTLQNVRIKCACGTAYVVTA